jgi:hypothetical protein
MTVKEPVPEADVCAITAAGIKIADTHMNNRANISIIPRQAPCGSAVSSHSQALIASNWGKYSDTYFYVLSLRIDIKATKHVAHPLLLGIIDNSDLFYFLRPAFLKTRERPDR